MAEKGSEIMLYNAGLILEGGAMRGVYTCGVIDCFIENDIMFKTVYGVSAGAGHAYSYLSHQKGRAFHANTDYLKGYNYLGLGSFIKTGSLFNMDLIYDTIPNKLLYFDHDAFRNSPMTLFAAVTNCETGKPEYIKVTDSKKQLDVSRASGSLPFISPPVKIGDKTYFDGGITDSIPLGKSISDGNELNVVVLTRDKAYRKSPEKSAKLIKMKYRQYPKLYEAVKNRHVMYNGELELIEAEERAGRAIVIRPERPVTVKRADTDMKKLTALYNDGYKDACKALAKIKKLPLSL